MGRWRVERKHAADAPERAIQRFERLCGHGRILWSLERHREVIADLAAHAVVQIALALPSFERVAHACVVRQLAGDELIEPNRFQQIALALHHLRQLRPRARELRIEQQRLLEMWLSLRDRDAGGIPRRRRQTIAQRSWDRGSWPWRTVAPHARHRRTGSLPSRPARAYRRVDCFDRRGRGASKSARTDTSKQTRSQRRASRVPHTDRASLTCSHTSSPIIRISSRALLWVMTPSRTL